MFCLKLNFRVLEPNFVRFGCRAVFSKFDFSNFKAAWIKGVTAKMKKSRPSDVPPRYVLNVIFVLRTINSFKLQGVHFYIIDIYYSGIQGVYTPVMT